MHFLGKEAINRMANNLNIEPSDCILDIGSGYGVTVYGGANPLINAARYMPN